MSPPEWYNARVSSVEVAAAEESKATVLSSVASFALNSKSALMLSPDGVICTPFPDV